MAHKWQAMSFWRSPKENQAACKQQQRQQRAPHKRRLWVKGGRGMPTGGGGRRTGLWNDPITCQSTKNKPHEEASPKLSAGSGAGVRGYTDEVKKVESSFGKYRFGVTIAYNINFYRKSLRVSKSMHWKMKVVTWIESIGSETSEYIDAYF